MPVITVILLTLQGETFRAEASISQAELPTMQKEAGMVGCIVKPELNEVGLPVSGLSHSNTELSHI